jgi:hypothetical protein
MKKIFTFLCAAFLAGSLISQTVVNLKDSTSSGALQRAIANAAYPSGSIFILNNAMTYDLVSTNLTKSFVVMNDINSTGKPTLSFAAGNSFNIATGGTIDSIKFMNVNFNSKSIAINTNGGYLFNNGSNVVILKKVFVENCNMSNMRGFVRLRTAGSRIDSISIFNCVFDSIGGYNVVTAENLSVVKNIFVSNSTFIKTERLIRTNNASSENVLINNCSFFNCPRNTYNMIDYGTGTINGTKSITNCIFGQIWNPATLSYGSGKVANPNTIVFTLNNNYKLNDFKQNDSATLAITKYDKPSSDLFTDITTVGAINLKIKDGTFPGATSTGDPRWYYTGTPTSIAKSTNNNTQLVVLKNELLFGSLVSKVSIYSINGKVVKSAQNVNQISTATLQRGIYIVKYIDKNNVTSAQKFIK